MEMVDAMIRTKKLLVAFDPVKQEPVRGEFLVPVKEGSRHSFIGLKSGSRIEKGILVFLGKDLGPADILGRLRKCTGISDESRAIDEIATYLEQLQEIRIGNVVVLESSSEMIGAFRLVKVANSPKVTPRPLP